MAPVQDRHVATSHRRSSSRGDVHERVDRHRDQGICTGAGFRAYGDLGFTIAWSDDDLAYMRYGECSFLLQNFYETS